VISKELTQDAIRSHQEISRDLVVLGLEIGDGANSGGLQLIDECARVRHNFVGDDEGGEHLATLLTVVSTCVASGVNPEAYVGDVLMRVGITPRSRLDETAGELAANRPGYYDGAGSVTDGAGGTDTTRSTRSAGS
jgi:hypothetical protein